MENGTNVEKKVTSKKTTVKKTTPVKTKIDPKTGTLKVVEKKTSTKKTPTTSKKASTKKATSTTKKVATKKKTTTPKKTSVKKAPVIEEKIPITQVESNPEAIVSTHTEEMVAPILNDTLGELTPIIVENNILVEPVPKKRGRKPSTNPLPKVSSRELTIEPPKRQPKIEPKKEDKKATNEPVVIVRPTPKKAKNFTKEEKVLYKKLQEAFNYVANFTNIIEERTMDIKQIPDLTVGELHVIEMVDQNNNKPMTLIAKKMKVTVGSLTISINRLVQKGYLLRTRHEMDHRIILVSITQKGKKVLKVHDQFHDVILGLVLDSLTLKQTLTVMNQFAMVLENYYDPKTIGSPSKKKGSNEK